VGRFIQRERRRCYKTVGSASRGLGGRTGRQRSPLTQAKRGRRTANFRRHEAEVNDASCVELPLRHLADRRDAFGALVALE